MTVFAALWLDAELTSQKAFTWYTIGVGVFGAVSWLILIFCFKFDDKKKNKLLETKETEEPGQINYSEQLSPTTDRD